VPDAAPVPVMPLLPSTLLAFLAALPFVARPSVPVPWVMWVDGKLSKRFDTGCCRSQCVMGRR
jgi:hypothetical protein